MMLDDDEGPESEMRSS